MLRTLWDRITGEEARAYQRAAERVVNRERERHQGEVRHMQRVALDAGVLLYREYDRIDVTEVGDSAPRYINGVYKWRARPLSDAERMGGAGGSELMFGVYSGDSAKEGGGE